MALQAMFTEAMALHQEGRLAEAERLYRDILRHQPGHYDALHLLGVVALQSGHPERAVELIGKAVALKPDFAEAYVHRGVALRNLKRFAEALADYDRAIALKPDYAEAHNNRGNVLQAMKRPAEALASYDRAIALKPGYFEAHESRGDALRNLKRPAQALASYDQAIALKPDIAEAHFNRGVVLGELQRLDDALASYDRAIALKPDFAEAYSNRGIILHDLLRHGEALFSCEQAIAFNPNSAEAHYNRGLALSGLQRPLDALASYDQAIALKPDFAEAYSNRGSELLELRRPEEALIACGKAIALRPDMAQAQWNQSLCLLLMGRFAEGWRQYEWRKKLDRPIAARSFPAPLWLGEDDIAGKTLFIWWEQGLGDTLQFCRYAKLAEAKGAKVVLSVQQPLHGLLKGLSPAIEIIGQADAPRRYDYHCPLLSLPLAFGTTLETIPAPVPYLAVDPEKSARWKRKLGEKKNVRVGLVWSGGFRPDQPKVWSLNERRNIPLAKLAQLMHPDIEFYSLQKGEPAAQLAELGRGHRDQPAIIDLTSELNDFADTAALVDNLDLVISVDTSTTHLAGAMGKPVWILNRFAACWRWLLERTDSPWYPTARLYRQPQAGDWDDVVRRVRADLRDWAAQR
jgi:tetratricopeptide (TPR) repeat protein